jgi:hypothetical protein
MINNDYNESQNFEANASCPHFQIHYFLNFLSLQDAVKFATSSQEEICFVRTLTSISSCIPKFQGSIMVLSTFKHIFM